MSDSDVQDKEICCSFCQQPKSEVANQELITGVTSDGFPAFICKACVKEANNLFYPEAEDEWDGLPSPSIETVTDLVRKPAEIVSYLDKDVVGQEHAKRAIANAVYRHAKTISDPTGKLKRKSNILLVGKTGTGKTQFARAMAKFLGVPFTDISCTSLTEAGYVGDDVESIFKRLLEAANWDVEKAQNGIIYLDEVCKIRKLSQNASITRDVSGEGVQQSLLKMIEGTVVSVPVTGSRKNPSAQNIQFDTSNILFIAGGAFAGIESFIKETREESAGIGFGASLSSSKKESAGMKGLTDEHLVQYGMIPEFIGRFPVTTVLNDLTVDILKRILVEPEDSIVKYYTALFASEGVDLIFEDKGLQYIAEQALESSRGARALDKLVDDLLDDAVFNLPSMEGGAVVVVKGDGVVSVTGGNIAPQAA